MRILLLCPHVPWPPKGGGKIRVASLAKELAARGHALTAWCTSEEPLPSDWTPPDFMDIVVHPVRPRPRNRNVERVSVLLSRLPETAWALRSDALIQRLRTLRPAQFDAIWLEQTHTGSLLPFIDRRSAPVVLVTENVEHDVRRQEAREKPWSRERARITLDSARLRRFERRVLSQVDAVTVVSEEDGARFARLGGLQRVVVIPNGVDPRYFAWHDHTENRRDRLLFTAHMGYPPNRDGCLWMCNTVMPEIRRRVPAAQLRLVGVGMGPEVRGRHNPAEGVEVVGEVDDVRPYMEDADLYVIPLRVGGGTRLKALEALAVGLPVVTTSRGVEGLGLTEAGLVVVADTPADFAAAVARVLGDRAQREHRIRAGRRFVEERYDWRSIAGVLEAELHRSHHRDSSTRT